MSLCGWGQLRSTRRYISAEVSFTNIIHREIRNTVLYVLWHLLSHLRSITTQGKKVFYRIGSRPGETETTQQVGHSLGEISVFQFSSNTVVSSHVYSSFRAEESNQDLVAMCAWCNFCLISFSTWVPGRWSVWNILEMFVKCFLNIQTM